MRGRRREDRSARRRAYGPVPGGCPGGLQRRMTRPSSRVIRAASSGVELVAPGSGLPRRKERRRGPTVSYGAGTDAGSPARAPTMTPAHDNGDPPKDLVAVRYAVDGPVARIALRGPTITLELPDELERCIEAADLDPRVHVIAITGDGPGFCGGYDLRIFAEGMGRPTSDADPQGGPPMDPATLSANHDPSRTWDPIVDFQMMSRFTRAWTSLARADKPTLCKVHGYAVAGGSDLALCADLLVIAADAKLAYPPSRVWGVPTTPAWPAKLPPQRAKRLLFTGDGLTGAEAEHWGLAADAPPADELDARFEALVQRVASVPVNQLVALKLFADAPHRGAAWATQTLGTLLDGTARHTSEGYAFAARAAEVGYRQAVAERDGPFGDEGRRVHRG